MKNRIQKLPPCFWGVHPQNDTHTFVYYFNGVEHVTSETRPNAYKVIGDDSNESKKKGFEAVARANAIGKMAICFAFNPVTKQNEVINFSEVGIYIEMTRCPNVVKAIEKAKHEVFPEGIPQIQIIK